MHTENDPPAPTIEHWQVGSPDGPAPLCRNPADPHGRAPVRRSDASSTTAMSAGTWLSADLTRLRPGSTYHFGIDARRVGPSTGTEPPRLQLYLDGTLRTAPILVTSAEWTATGLEFVAMAETHAVTIATLPSGDAQSSEAAADCELGAAVLTALQTEATVFEPAGANGWTLGPESQTVSLAQQEGCDGLRLDAASNATGVVLFKRLNNLVAGTVYHVAFELDVVDIPPPDAGTDVDGFDPADLSLSVDGARFIEPRTIWPRGLPWRLDGTFVANADSMIVALENDLPHRYPLRLLSVHVRPVLPVAPDPLDAAAPYRDVTDFQSSADPFNGWHLGAAAAGSVLVPWPRHEQTPATTVLQGPADQGAAALGPVLLKTFSGLKKGSTYLFQVAVHRRCIALPDTLRPIWVMELDGKVLAGPIHLTGGRTWAYYGFTFQPTAQTHTLSIRSIDHPAPDVAVHAPGSNFVINHLLVRELQVHQTEFARDGMQGWAVSPDPAIAELGTEGLLLHTSACPAGSAVGKHFRHLEAGTRYVVRAEVDIPASQRAAGTPPLRAVFTADDSLLSSEHSIQGPETIDAEFLTGSGDLAGVTQLDLSLRVLAQAQSTLRIRSISLDDVPRLDPIPPPRIRQARGAAPLSGRRHHHLTDFEDAHDPLNGWSQSSGGRLELARELNEDGAPNTFMRGIAPARCAQSRGMVMGREFSPLTPGADYHFSMKARRTGASDVHACPLLAFKLDGVTQTADVRIDSSNWVTVGFAFRAVREHHHIVIWARSHFSQGSPLVTGTNLDLDELVLKQV